MMMDLVRFYFIKQAGGVQVKLSISDGLLVRNDIIALPWEEKKPFHRHYSVG